MISKELLDIKAMTKANIYWDGKVISRTYHRKDGSKFTLGVITAGTYTFDVGDKEVVSLIAGEAEIILPEEKEWHSVKTPDIFEIPAHSQYQIRTPEVVEYLCDYIPD